MKTIIFAIDKFQRGGIQNVLVRYVNGFQGNEKYNVEILLKEEVSQNSDILGDLINKVKINYIKSRKFVEFRDYHRENKKKSIISKMVMAVLLPIERVLMQRGINNFFKNRDDIVACVDFQSSFWSYMKKIKVKKIGRVAIDPKGSYKKNTKQKIERAKSYDKILLISKDMIEDYLECYPFAKDKIVHIYNPIDLNEVRAKQDDYSTLTEVEKELIKEEYIVAISMLNKRKARDELIKVYKKLVDQGYKEKLYILGNGSERANLEQLVKDLKLEERVKFLGMKSNTFVWTKYAKVFAHPSYGEGLPNSLIEAMATNTPIIAYDCPTGPNDILDGGKYGILVKMGDMDSLEESIETLLKSDELRNKYKELMKERIKDFSIETSVKNMEEMVDSFGKK